MLLNRAHIDDWKLTIGWNFSFCNWNRFDLVFILLDKPEVVNDKRLAEHIMNSKDNKTPSINQSNTQLDVNVEEIDNLTLKLNDLVIESCENVSNI